MTIVMWSGLLRWYVLCIGLSILLLQDLCTPAWSLSLKAMPPLLPPQDNPGSTLKLPIIQVVNLDMQLVSELVLGDTRSSIDGNMIKLKATLSSIAANSKQTYSGSVDPTKDNQKGWENIYSDEALRRAFQQSAHGKMSVLKLYSTACRSCVAYEPHLAALLNNNSVFQSAFQYIQADTGNVPEYMLMTRNRLMGLSDRSVLDNTCKGCSGTGTVPCDLCEGKGYIMTGSIASFCNKCSGKKVVRCEACGGKCVACA